MTVPLFPACPDIRIENISLFQPNLKETGKYCFLPFYSARTKWCRVIKRFHILKLKKKLTSDYTTLFKHRLRYEKMTASTPNMFIAGYSNKPPEYKIRPDNDDLGTKDVADKVGERRLDVTYGNEKFSQKRFGIKKTNEKTSLYPY